MFGNFCMPKTFMKYNFYTLCVAVIAGILLAEAVLWVFFPINEIGGGNRNISVQNTNIPGLKKQFIYDENSFGFRSLSMQSEKKPPHTVRILCLGHSTTTQPTQSTEDIWSSILGKKLQERFSSRGTRIEVAARGYGGECVKQTLSWAQKNILKYQPDLVILLEGVNDFCWSRFAREVPAKDVRGQDPRQDHLLKVSQIYRRLNVLKSRFELEDLIKKGGALDWHSQNLPALRKKYQDLTYAEVPHFDPRLIDEFSANLSSLLGFFRDAKIPVIVLGQPVLWKDRMSIEEKNALWFPVQTPGLNNGVRPSTGWLVNEMTVYNQVQQKVSEKFNAPYVDMDKKIPKNLQYFFDDCHLTDLGNVKVADVIFPVVEKQVENIIR